MEAPTFFWWGDLIYGIGALVIGIIAYALGPAKRVNQLLFMVMLLEAANFATFGYAAGQFFAGNNLDPRFDWAFTAVGVISIWLILPFYLVFIAHVAPTPRTAFLRGNKSIAVAFAIGFALMAVMYLINTTRPEVFVTYLIWQNVVYFAVPAIFYSATIFMAVGYYRAQRVGTLERSNARLVVAAVVVRDAPWIFLYLWWFVVLATEIIGEEASNYWRESAWIPFLFAFLILASIGVFRGQLVDLDRKIHRSINKGTIAGIFIAVFVAVQTLVSEFFTTTVGLIGGAVAAGLLFFALQPLQRMAERVADKAAPRGSKTVQLSGEELEQFYREQVEIAYSDGAVRAKERNALHNLRDRLGLTVEFTTGIEETFLRAGQQS